MSEIIIEQYGEKVSEYEHLLHEASESRYILTKYDLCVLE